MLFFNFIKQRRKKKIRQKLGLVTDNVLLVTTSRLVKKNGVGDIIEAIRSLEPSVKLLIVGGGYLESNLKLKVQNAKLEDRVKFLGFVPHEKLPPYLWASDIFVRPSLSEGMGNSFIEAMAAGLPVVGTPVGGITDFLFSPLFYEIEKQHVSNVPNHLFSNSHELENRWGKEFTGLFCEPRNPKSVARTVVLLTQDTVLREKIVQNASKMVSEKYDWKFVAQRMFQLFSFQN